VDDKGRRPQPQERSSDPVRGGWRVPPTGRLDDTGSRNGPPRGPWG